MWGALRPHAGGAPSLEINAKTIRELFRKLQEEYPGMEPHIRRGVAVSIGGRIWRDSWDQPLPQDTEIYLMPRIPGG
jgi:molybdopterin converting factor small subunit